MLKLVIIRICGLCWKFLSVWKVRIIIWCLRYKIGLKCKVWDLINKLIFLKCVICIKMYLYF